MVQLGATGFDTTDSAAGGDQDLRRLAELPLSEQLSLLQRQQAFEAELRVHEQRLSLIDARCERLSADKLLAQRRQRLADQWQTLVSAVQRRNKAFEQARNLLNFEQLIETAWNWIKNKVKI